MSILLEETFYKIRNPETGLFSSGGSMPNWTKRGKVWRGVGPLKNHLNLIMNRAYYGRRNRAVYDGCELVTVQVTTEEVSAERLSDFLDERDAQIAAQERERQEASKRMKERRERAMLKKLQQKYPD